MTDEIGADGQIWVGSESVIAVEEIAVNALLLKWSLPGKKVHYEESAWRTGIDLSPVTGKELSLIWLEMVSDARDCLIDEAVLDETEALLVMTLTEHCLDVEVVGELLLSRDFTCCDEPCECLS